MKKNTLLLSSLKNAGFALKNHDEVDPNGFEKEIFLFHEVCQ
jgi:hypothetical protein